MRLAILLPLVLSVFVKAHIAAWHLGMYCLGGTSGTDDPNSSAPVTPLYQLTKRDWWFHHVNRCDEFPPAPGVFLDLPAGGSFTVEMAGNRGQTTLSFNGRFASDWPDGQNHPDNWNVPTCITSPNLHTQNETMAAGSAFAISYVSELSQVTEENLAVFTVKAQYADVQSSWERD
ncbi:hypothetical protein HGRIS_014079 [Hohenbuehelia grisea]|uniref:Uncharacterized protein n=1 Tax=Hohenbuehelia grisea TaxID=104357 RepID=A0ABR3JUG5_9AGAR